MPVRFGFFRQLSR